MKCNVLSGDAVFCFKIAHDETFARFSPGVQLELRTSAPSTNVIGFAGRTRVPTRTMR